MSEVSVEQVSLFESVEWGERAVLRSAGLQFVAYLSIEGLGQKGFDS